MKGTTGNNERLYPTIALACVALFAAWMGDANGGYFVGGWVPPALFLAALALLISTVGPLGGARPRWGILALAVFGVYTAWTFASILWSPNQGDAWLGAGQTLLYLLAIWVTVALTALGASRRWLLAATVVGPGGVAALTLLTLVPRAGDLFKDDRLIGTVGYYNGEAAFLLISFWVAVYLGGSRRVEPLLRGAALSSAALCLQLAVLTQSRGAMVAMALSLPVYFLLSGQRLRGLLALAPVALGLLASFPGLNGVYLAYLNGADATAALAEALPAVWLAAALAGLYGGVWALVDRRWNPSERLTRTAGGIVLAACAIVLVCGATVLVDGGGNPATLAQERWEAFKANDTTGKEQSRYLSASGSGRYTLWQVAWKDFVAHPAIGVGTQNYEATYYALRERSSGYVRQPHSLPLEVLAERGVVGGTLLLGFLVVCLTAAIRNRFGTPRPEGKAQMGALVAAVAYWFTHSGAEWFWQLPAVTLPAFVYLALMVSPWQREQDVPASPRGSFGPALRIGGVGIAALALAVLLPLYVADRYMARSQEVADPKEALALVQRAQRYNPLNPRLPQTEAEMAARIGDRDRAEEAHRRAIRLNPEHYAPYKLLAEFYEGAGDPERAISYHREALARNPLDKELARHVGREQDGARPDDESR